MGAVHWLLPLLSMGRVSVDLTQDVALKTPSYSPEGHLRCIGNKSIWDRVFMLGGWMRGALVYYNNSHSPSKFVTHSSQVGASGPIQGL